MGEPDAAERELLLGQLRELGGLGPGAPPAGASAPARVPGLEGPRLSALELRRLSPHIERLAAFKAAHGRLPGAGPSALVGERSLGAWLWQRRRARAEGRLHPHAAQLLEDVLGPHWHLPPRRALALEQRYPGSL